MIKIENVNLDALDKLEAERLPIYPSPKTLRLIQNKGKQKDYYVSNDIPTSPHQRFVDLNDLKILEKTVFLIYIILAASPLVSRGFVQRGDKKKLRCN